MKAKPIAIAAAIVIVLVILFISVNNAILSWQ